MSTPSGTGGSFGRRPRPGRAAVDGGRRWSAVPRRCESPRSCDRCRSAGRPGVFRRSSDPLCRERSERPCSATRSLLRAGSRPVRLHSSCLPPALARRQMCGSRSVLPRVVLTQSSRQDPSPSLPDARQQYCLRAGDRSCSTDLGAEPPGAMSRPRPRALRRRAQRRSRGSLPHR